MRAGAMGYLLKDVNVDEIADAIYQVHAGKMPLHPAVARRLVGSMTHAREEADLKAILTRRELEILPL